MPHKKPKKKEPLHREIGSIPVPNGMDRDRMLEEVEKSFLEGVEIALEVPAYTEVDPITGDKSSVPLPQGEGHTDPSLLPPKEALEGGKAIVVAEPEAKPDLSKRKAFAQWLDTNFKATGAPARTDEKRRAKLL